jgi:dienelactone hydrolase
LKAGSALAATGALAGGLSAGRGAGAAETRPATATATAKSAAAAELTGCPPGYPKDLPAAEVRRRFLQVLGEFTQPSVPLKPAVTEEIELPGGIIRQRVEYDVEPGERVPAYHLFRRGLPADAPGLLSIHAHGGSGIFPVGKAYHCHPQADDPLQYSYRGALAGFRVLAPDALLFGERPTRWGGSFFNEVVAHAELCARGLSLAWKSVWDNSRALEMLEHLGARRLGVIGLSGGSTQGYILAAANEKVRAAACYASFATLRHQYYRYRLAHCLYHYIPGMVKAEIDWDQVVATAAPRGLFLERGGLDAGTPEPMYRAFVTAVERRCARDRLPPSLMAFEEPQVAHAVTEPGLKAGLEFLRKHLEAPG